MTSAQTPQSVRLRSIWLCIGVLLAASLVLAASPVADGTVWKADRFVVSTDAAYDAASRRYEVTGVTFNAGLVIDIGAAVASSHLGHSTVIVFRQCHFKSDASVAVPVAVLSAPPLYDILFADCFVAGALRLDGNVTAVSALTQPTYDRETLTPLIHLAYDTFSRAPNAALPVGPRRLFVRNVTAAAGFALRGVVVPSAVALDGLANASVGGEDVGYVVESCAFATSRYAGAGLELSHVVMESLPLHVASSTLRSRAARSTALRIVEATFMRNALLVVTDTLVDTNHQDYRGLFVMRLERVHAELNAGVYLRNLRFELRTSTSATASTGRAIFIGGGCRLEGFWHWPTERPIAASAFTSAPAINVADCSDSFGARNAGSFAAARYALCRAASRRAALGEIADAKDIAAGGGHVCLVRSRNDGDCIDVPGETDGHLSLSFVSQLLSRARFGGEDAGPVLFNGQLAPATIYTEPGLIPAEVSAQAIADEPVTIRDAALTKTVTLAFTRDAWYREAPLPIENVNASARAARLAQFPQLEVLQTIVRSFALVNVSVGARLTWWYAFDTPRLVVDDVSAESMWVSGHTLPACGGLLWFHRVRFSNHQRSTALRIDNSVLSAGAIVVTNAVLDGRYGLHLKDFNATRGSDIRVLRSYVKAYWSPARALVLDNVHVTGGSALRIVRSTVFGHHTEQYTQGEGRGLFCVNGVTLGHSPLYAIPYSTSNYHDPAFAERLPWVSQLYRGRLLSGSDLPVWGNANETRLWERLPEALEAIEAVGWDDDDDRALRWGFNHVRARKRSTERAIDCAAATDAISAGFAAHLLRGTRPYADYRFESARITAIPAPAAFGRHPFLALDSQVFVVLAVSGTPTARREALLRDQTDVPERASSTCENAAGVLNASSHDVLEVAHCRFDQGLLVVLSPCTARASFHHIAAKSLELRSGTVVRGGNVTVHDVTIREGIWDNGLLLNTVEVRRDATLTFDRVSTAIWTNRVPAALRFLNTDVSGADVTIRDSYIRATGNDMLGALMFQGARFRDGATLEIVSSIISTGYVYGDKCRSLSFWLRTQFIGSTLNIRDSQLLADDRDWSPSVRFGDRNGETPEAESYFENGTVLNWHNVHMPGHVRNYVGTPQNAGPVTWRMRFVRMTDGHHWQNRPTFFESRGRMGDPGNRYELSCTMRLRRFLTSVGRTGLPSSETNVSAEGCEAALESRAMVVDTSSELFTLPVCDPDPAKRQWQFAAQVASCKRMGDEARIVARPNVTVNYTVTLPDGNTTVNHTDVSMCHATCPALDRQASAFDDFLRGVELTSPFEAMAISAPFVRLAGCAGSVRDTPTKSPSLTGPTKEATRSRSVAPTKSAEATSTAASAPTATVEPDASDATAPPSATRRRERAATASETDFAGEQTRVRPSVTQEQNSTGRSTADDDALTSTRRRGVRLRRGIDVLARASGPVTAVAGVLLGPGVANKGANLGRLIGVARCHIEDDAEDADAPPWYKFALPLPLRLEDAPPQRSEQDGATQPRVFPAALGAIVSTTVLLLVALGAVAAVATHAAPASQRPRKYAGVLFAVLLSFYGPNVVAVSVVLLGHSALMSERAVGGAAVVLVCALLAGTAVVVHRLGADAIKRVHRYLGTYNDRDAAAVSGPTPDEHASVVTASAWVLAPFVESARDPVPHVVRVHAIEDVAAAVAIAVIAGFKPPEDSSCVGVASAMLVIALLHTGYVWATRPYLEKWEQRFAAATAGLQALVAGAMLAVTLHADQLGAASGATQEADPVVLAVAAGLAYALAGLLYVQMVALAVVEVRHIRRRLWRGTAADKAVEATDGTAPSVVGETEVPLLVRPMLGDAESDSQRAGLADVSCTPPRSDAPLANPLAR